MGTSGSAGAVGAKAVERAAAVTVALLGGCVERDWGAPAGGLEWSCRETVVHVAHDLTAYAAQLAGRVRGPGYLPLDLTVPESAGRGEVVEVLSASAALLATVVRAAPAGARGWHWGACDASGFAAMGVAELTLHTWDVARGLGVAWEPPVEAAEAVLGRLFPPAVLPDPPRASPSDLLLWATGRTVLPDRPRRTDWVWRAALE
ncbi:maleylpyruvate isomerase N-terminal domain-containing protein [Streptomyces sp. BI20]|uniref:maleylpyruvate isomerase N-terminal domain-containing protein n=1 Tax=Streptomyces sp. BI20 TaxID=3403460 RepID=UPI003C777F3D